MATNRADTLDPALLRPGRLDRKIEFPLPDRRQKRLIFSTITSKMNLSEEVKIKHFAREVLRIFLNFRLIWRITWLDQTVFLELILTPSVKKLACMLLGKIGTLCCQKILRRVTRTISRRMKVNMNFINKFVCVLSLCFFEYCFA